MFASHVPLLPSNSSYLSSPGWQEIDRAISELALRRAEADHEEGRWLIAAQRAAVHTRLGFATFFEYIERRLGYDARTTAERLRVARSLVQLPALAFALKSGARPWSAVRELTRVAAPETETEWLSATDGKTVRQIEKLVLGKKLGDRPSDPKRPELERRVVRFELSPEAYARMKEAFERVRAEVDPHLSEEEALVELCDRMLGGTWDGETPPHQVLITKCEDCGRAWQKAKSESVEVGPEVVECAECDRTEIRAAHVGTESGASDRPTRAKRTNPPALWRFIHHRDRGCCIVPGCRNTRYVAVHHFELVAEGGQNEPDRMGLVCSTHHRLIHRGLLIMEGSVSTGLRFQHADGTEYGRPVRPADVDANATAFAGLRSLGFGEGESKRLLSAARAHVGASVSAEVLLKAALRATRSGGMIAREGGCGWLAGLWPGTHVCDSGKVYPVSGELNRPGFPGGSGVYAPSCSWALLGTGKHASTRLVPTVTAMRARPRSNSRMSTTRTRVRVFVTGARAQSRRLFARHEVCVEQQR